MTIPGLPDIFVSAALLLTAILCIRFRKLTVAGALWAIMLGMMLYYGAGFSSLVLLAVFFLSATAATAYRKKEKAAMLGKMVHEERRTALQVLANGGVPLLAGMAALLFPDKFNAELLIAAALSSATSDTLSSELGMVWGKRFFNISTFRREAPGADGVVSVEGTFAGILGAAMTGSVFYLFNRETGAAFIVCAAGIGGNLTDSLLGAWFERKQLLGNNAVNFLNTFVAAGIAWLLLLLS
ncbi:MAG: DUF92 domain-containing protein [Chitinophagaceae bacterium]